MEENIIDKDHLQLINVSAGVFEPNSAGLCPADVVQFDNEEEIYVPFYENLSEIFCT